MHYYVNPCICTILTHFKRTFPTFLYFFRKCPMKRTFIKAQSRNIRPILKMKVTEMFCASGWYRGFILKNPNAKVSNCLFVFYQVCQCWMIFSVTEISQQHCQTKRMDQSQSLFLFLSVCFLDYQQTFSLYFGLLICYLSFQGIFPCNYIHLKNAQIKNKG